MQRTALLGRDHTTEGAWTAQGAAGWGIAISKGWESPARKVDANEDAGAVVDGVVRLAAVADAHWGGSSAWRFAQVVADSEVDDSLAEMFRTTSTQLGAASERSECAALVVRVEGRQVRWVSIGDCRCYRVSTKGVEVLNRLQHSYLGADPSWLPLEEGMRILESGDRLVLVSDGVPECTYGEESFMPAEVAATVRGGDPREAAGRLAQAALDRGGEDNIVVVVLDVV